MMIKVAVSDCFKLKMIPSFRSVFFPEKQEIHYIGGAEILPPPLESGQEKEMISRLGTGNDENAKKTLIEHNLRLVVYIAKKFDFFIGKMFVKLNYVGLANIFFEKMAKRAYLYLMLY